MDLTAPSIRLTAPGAYYGPNAPINVTPHPPKAVIYSCSCLASQERDLTIVVVFDLSVSCHVFQHKVLK